MAQIKIVGIILQDNQNICPAFAYVEKILGTKFLNADEKDQGEFAVNLLYPAIGIQYMQLGGEYAGVGVHAKILMLMDVDDFVAAPTGEVGVSFYF